MITRSEANKTQSNEINIIIDANGSWQSVCKWAENDGLYEEQKTAFEILVASYVLSFYDEAVVENDEQFEEFDEKRDSLMKLARQNTNDSSPLRMFLTGPAGAGKCKSENIFVFTLKNYLNF
jgi:flagellar biosynthesis GTPase FlhF